MSGAAIDAEFMAAALALAARNLGDTWPNPSVGCVLVKDGIVVGRGWTQAGGRPHAETEALKRAGTAAKGATAYVTLEPCSHHGKTPPCAEALIAAGIARVVVAATDPYPQVNGQGLAKLRAAGIEVTEGVRKAEAERLNAGFILRVTKNRPLFALKTATTQDARIALANGKSQWITGELSRQAAHALRARFDAILVGSGTALVDNPDLTCRMEGYTGRPKVRIVLDRRGRLPESVKLVTTARQIPTWVATENTPKATELAIHGVEIISPNDIGAALAARGITRVLIEGGGEAAATLIKDGLVDEIAWFRAPTLIGGDGKPAISTLDVADLAAMPGFKRRETLTFGADTLDMLDRHAG